MRAQFNNYGLIVGKYSPKVRGGWIPYGGYEYGGFASFEVLDFFFSSLFGWINGKQILLLDPSSHKLYMGR